MYKYNKCLFAAETTFLQTFFSGFNISKIKFVQPFIISGAIQSGFICRKLASKADPSSAQHETSINDISHNSADNAQLSEPHEYVTIDQTYISGESSGNHSRVTSSKSKYVQNVLYRNGEKQTVDNVLYLLNKD